MAIPEDPPIDLFADMLPAIRLFASCSGQWRMHPVTGALVDLDYAAVDLIARWTGVEMTPRLFDDVRALAAGWREEVGSWR